MELREYLRILGAHKWTIALSAIITCAVALALGLTQTPLYEAESNLLISESSASSSGMLDAALSGFSVQPERGLQTQVRMLQMRPAFESTIRRLDLRMRADELRKRTDIAGEGQTNVISIHVRDANPKRAARIADTLAEEYSLWVREFSRARIRAAAEEVEKQLEDARAQIVEMTEDTATLTNKERVALEIAGQDYAGLSDQLRQLRIREQMEVGPVQVVSKAALPDEAVSPQPARNAALGLAVGLVFGVAAAFGIEALDNTVKSTDEAAAVTGAPVLGVVPAVKDAGDIGVVLGKSSSPVAEAFRGIRNSLDFINFEHQIRTILVTSSAPGEGKSTAAVNLASGLARAGNSVVLISVDFHRPKSAEYLGVNEAMGLSHVLLGQYPLDACLQTTQESGLFILASGRVPPNPSELLGSQRFGELLAGLKERADWVILDGPPVLAVADTTAAAKWVDGTIMVVRAGKTARDAVQRAVEMLSGVGARVIGTVLMGVSDSSGGAGTYAYSAYSYKRTTGQRR